MKRPFLCYSSPPAWAQPLQVQTSQNADSALRPLTTQQQATVWGVTPEEWQRYLTLKQQARGVWSPGLDPLTTLGVEADTDHERQRFAELLVRQEYQRLEKELAFQRAYDAAPATPVSGPDAAENHVRQQPAFRYLLKMTAAPDSLLRTLLAQQRPLDIWLVNSEGDDNRVRRWAMAHGIDKNWWSEHSITLNHDAGRWFLFGGRAKFRWRWNVRGTMARGPPPDPAAVLPGAAAAGSVPARWSITACHRTAVGRHTNRSGEPERQASPVAVDAQYQRYRLPLCQPEQACQALLAAIRRTSPEAH